jgi:2-methylcitrate dehydratase
MERTTVQRLAQWVLDFNPSEISPTAVQLMKHSVLDSLGCAFATLGETCVEGIVKVANSIGGTPQASIIGGGKAPVGTAALVNGALVRAIDFNDHLAWDPNDRFKLGGHPSDNLPALLAIAEWRDLSGANLLAGLLIGYEVYGRIYRLFSPERPWDHTTAFGFSVPAAVARLLGLDASRAANAIAISAAQSASLGVVRRGQLSHSKFLASALVAERGVQAALLAEVGVTGPMTVFEDVRGVVSAIFGTSDGLEAIHAPFAGHHMVEGVTLKSYPGMDTSQAAVEAALKAGERRKLGANDIAGLRLIMNDHPMTIQQANDLDRRTPSSRETADHSFYYLVAVALLDGELTPRQFSDGRWFDPEVRELMSRIEICIDPTWKMKAPGGFPCTVVLSTTDGVTRTVEVPFACGHPHNRMTCEQVVEKFRRCAEGRLEPRRAETIVAMVDGLDQLRSVRDLAKLLAV